MLHAIIAFTEGELSILKIKVMTSNQDFSNNKSCQWKDQILFFKQQITEGLYFVLHEIIAFTEGELSILKTKIMM